MKNVLSTVTLWIIIIIITLLPLSLSKYGIELYLMPQMEILIIFLLSLYKNINATQVFLYGLLIDVSYANPIGFSPFILLAINRIILRFKSSILTQDMLSIWIYFTYTAMIVALLKHLVFTFSAQVFLSQNISYTLINLLVNISFYPLLHWALLRSSYNKS